MHVCRRSVELCLFIVAFMAALAAVAAVKTLAVLK
jgi:hypothetical protein